jgi:hypothetical protein
VCHFKQPVSQCAFPMINVGNDTEIPDVFHVCKDTVLGLFTEGKIFVDENQRRMVTDPRNVYFVTPHKLFS